jgi:hypothetical protein
MPSISDMVPMSFIMETILIIFMVVGIGIMGVKRAKKRQEQE